MRGQGERKKKIKAQLEMGVTWGRWPGTRSRSSEGLERCFGPELERVTLGKWLHRPSASRIGRTRMTTEPGAEDRCVG